MDWLIIAVGLALLGVVCAGPILIVLAMLKRRWRRSAVYLSVWAAVTGAVLLAIPSQPNYTHRAKVSEGLNLAAPAKTAVGIFYAETARLPASNAEVGLPAPSAISGPYVDGVEILAGGVIAVSYGGGGLPEDMAGKTIVLTPSAGETGLSWDCAQGSMPRRHRPSTCR